MVKSRSQEPKLFRLLENTVWNPYGVNNSRNAAAIVAARMSENSSGDVFADYKTACKEYGLLPDEQKKDIEDFLARTCKISDVLVEGFLFRRYAEFLSDDAAIDR